MQHTRIDTVCTVKGDETSGLQAVSGHIWNPMHDHTGNTSAPHGAHQFIAPGASHGNTHEARSDNRTTQHPGPVSKQKHHS
jgi:hypothetical protein